MAISLKRGSSRLVPPDRGAKPKSAALCQACQLTTPQQVELSHDLTGAHLRLCLPCLRSGMRIKADTSQDRSRNLLHEYANEFGGHVWRSTNILYVLPCGGAYEPGDAEARTCQDGTA